MIDPKVFIANVEQAFRERREAPGCPPLTRLHVHVAAKLAFWRSPMARHRSLARAASCSVRTVRRALCRLNALGLLSWTRRVFACRGWRAQIANAYHLNASSLPDYQRIKSSAVLAPPGGRTLTAAPTGATDLLVAARHLIANRMLAARQAARM